MGEKLSQNEKSGKSGDFEPVFKLEEIRNRVRTFILAFSDRQISVRFLKDEEIRASTTWGRSKAIENEHILEKRFLELVQICSGSIETDSVKLEKSYHELFRLISKLQMLRRIEGGFTKPGVEERIKKLEKWKEKTNPLIKELIEYAETGIWKIKE